MDLQEYQLGIGRQLKSSLILVRPCRPFRPAKFPSKFLFKSFSFPYISKLQETVNFQHTSKTIRIKSLGVKQLFFF